MINRIRSIVLVAIGRAEAVPFTQPEGWEKETDAYWTQHTCFACGWISDSTVENGVCTRPNTGACEDRRASAAALRRVTTTRRIPGVAYTPRPVVGPLPAGVRRFPGGSFTPIAPKGEWD